MACLRRCRDAVLGIDEAGVIRLVNTQAGSLFGHGLDDMVGVSHRRVPGMGFGRFDVFHVRPPGLRR